MPQIEDNAVAVPNAHESDAGKIKKISMHNFMCYESKEIVLNDKVNFFVGPNGSGKSAILTALTVGLGGNLERFGDAANVEETFLEGLVKEGQKEATIEITLSNVGSNAYNPDIYGQTITVRRTIGSTTGYQIKKSSGETVSTEKSDLRAILNQLKIQVDNPICILNKDLARTFLIASNGSKKYELFLKGTRLDVLYQRLDDSIESGEAMKSCKNVLVEETAQIRGEMMDILMSLLNAEPELQENLILRLASLTEKYDIFYEEINKLKDEILIEDSPSNMRKTQLETLISEIEQRVCYTFREILRSKNYEGLITIDHEHKTLEFKVTPAKDSKETFDDKNTGNTLTMAAFILALWDCTKLPFYFLDEFDVFMDKTQRRLAMDMLLEYMKKHPTKQFGLLTPLDVEHIEANDTVSIHKLAAPEGNGNNHNN